MDYFAGVVIKVDDSGADAIDAVVANLMMFLLLVFVLLLLM